MPKSSIVPESSGTRPRIVRTSVDLPEPLAPRIATTWLGRDVQGDVVQDRAAAVGDGRVLYGDDAHEVHSRAAVRALRLPRMTEK
nr:hypothetical protein GCM10020092_090960 [Actinoplanes digitatis]